MSRLGQYLWPRRLYGQILLVVALALFVAQSINAAMLLAGSRNRAIVETATMVVGRVVNQVERERERGVPIGEVRERQSSQGPQHRRRSAAISLIVSDAPLTLDRYEKQTELTDHVTEFLAQSDTGLTDIRISSGSLLLLPPELRDAQLERFKRTKFRGKERPAPRFAVLFSARTSDGRWINAAGLVRPSETSSIIGMLLQTLTLYIAVMIPLAFVVRRVAKPLERLTERVQRVGLVSDVSPLASAGPADIRQLIDAFNNMQSRVSALLGEKDVMLGAIGHDLKTPLAALRVRVESVEDDAERDKMAATIDEMVTILDDILMLARLGKSGEASQRTDIGALIGSVVEDFPGVVLIDPEQRVVANVRPILLRRALRNLIGNAITYGKSASISVRIDAGQLLIQIDDDGPGIPGDRIESMFEPFGRVETSRSRSTGGSGLGLTISRAIARSHNGDVHLENRSQGGLRATIAIPVA